jgi:hypothetical protein
MLLRGAWSPARSGPFGRSPVNDKNVKRQKLTAQVALENRHEFTQHLAQFHV